MVWLSNVMISQKTYSKGLPFAHLKKEKMIFLKIDKNITLQRKVSTPQSLKEKFRSFWNFLLNKLILKSPCRLDQRSLSLPWLTKCLPTTLELRLDLILLKGVRRQSTKDSVLIIWMTLWIGPALLNYVWTWSSQKRYVGSLSMTLSQSFARPSYRSNFWTTSGPNPPKRGT